MPLKHVTVGPVCTQPEFESELLHNFVSSQGRDYNIFNPNIEKATTVKGQLHAHSNAGGDDGADTPTALVTAYKNQGYGFCVITGHNVLTPDPEVADMLYIPGIEMTLTQAHMLNLGASGYTAQTEIQTMIDAIITDDAIASWAHPSWASFPMQNSKLQHYRNYSLIEVRNAVIGDTVGDNTPEVKWDRLLAAKKPVWGIFVDDCHDISDADQFNKFFIVCRVDSISVANIKEALRNGNFYCSTPGAPVPVVSVSGNVVTITTDIAADFEFIGLDGTVLKDTDTNTTTGTYTIEGWEMYVRCRITKYGSTEKSLAQPVIINTLGEGFKSPNLPFYDSLASIHQSASLSIPVTTQKTRAELDTIDVDTGNNLTIGDWYGASGAYRQADADSDATHIEDDDAAFPAPIDGAYVKWASDAAGTLNTGTGIVSYIDADTCFISKISGANFAASYYYWIKKAHYVAPKAGWYLAFGITPVTPVEDAKIVQSYIYCEGVLAGNENHHTSGTVTLRPGCTAFFHANMGDRIALLTLYTGTVNTGSLYGHATILNAARMSIFCLQED